MAADSGVADKGWPRPKVDCHTHIGAAGTHVHETTLDNEERVTGRRTWDVDPADHKAATETPEHTFVLAFDAPQVGIVVPNEDVAAHVAGSDTMIGFASINPNRPDAVAILETAVRQLGLKGLKVGPVYQHFHPHSEQAFELMEAAEALQIPVVWHFGNTFVRDVPMEYGNPILVDKIARQFPELRMWIAHLGVPWYADTMLVIRRHQHVYADISAAHFRPFQYYLAMVSAAEYRVLDRLLFGSDYPFATVEETVEALARVNRFAQGTDLPKVPEDALEGIVARDALALLGIEVRR